MFGREIDDRVGDAKLRRRDGVGGGVFADP
jgi:hypothetical protein